MLVIVIFIVLGMRILRVPLHRNCKLAEDDPCASVTFIRVIGS